MPPIKPTFFRTTAALARWLAKYGTTRTELWIGYYKKASGKGGVVYKQALDEALCVGWIDGVVKSIDDECYMQRWTPRKMKSIWSNVNVRKVQQLIADGRMKPAGLAAFARRDPERSGIYSFENAPLEFPVATAKRFKANRKAWTFFEAQPPGYRRSVTAYVVSAKQEATRVRRLDLLIAHCARGERIPPFVTPSKRNAAAVKKR